MSMVPSRLASLVFLVLLIGSSSLAQAPPVAVDLELVLLADSSGSIDTSEHRLQREGYAAALRHPEVLKAITSGARQRIAVTYVEWADDTAQDVVVPWTIIDGAATADAFSADLLKGGRRAYGRNAIGAALLKGKDLIETNAIEGERRVIDFSADSANSWSGPSIADAREAVLKAGIVINGLAILCREAACSGRPAAYNLEATFASEIIGGPGSFVVTVESRGGFAEAVRRKLVMEMSAAPVSTGRQAAVGGAFRRP